MNDNTNTNTNTTATGRHRAVRRPSNLALALLASGSLAWVLVGVVVLLAMRGGEDQRVPESEPLTEQVAGRPTLAAMTQPPTLTYTPTNTPTRTPSRTPSPAPSATPMPTATQTLTPEPLPVMATATEPPVPIITLAVSAVPDEPGAPEVVSPDFEAMVPTMAPVVAEAVPVAACAPPEGWEAYTVQPGDTLFAFVLGAGAEAGLTVDDLLTANCLRSRYLSVDQVLYLPPGAAENAPSSEPYVPPAVAGARGPRPGSCPCTLTVYEGWRREQIADAVTNSGTSFTGADFLAATGAGVGTSFDFVNARPGGVSMEGYLFPGTYSLSNETTAEQFRDMLLAAFDANVSGQMRADASAQGVTFHQALTIASIVQREVRAPETQRLAASVYYNLYRDGGRLGSTVTTQYALGRPGAWWPRVNSINIDSPYNTYKVNGLPPGPICNPGMGALSATVYPPQTNYRFHTASCNGTGEVFAETFEEHLRNVNCEG